ncbi:DUF1654 domain-containing protein [Pseudomonas typographi]|uniref:DUF1654 domain-containing protein n=1 Tax=Pseudomonas typographi TaxID=2715964 RepID=A0ABR7Z9Z9_9PSED|nr:DUF1654 domain-containing protein [Pseudomonas typographi]MBD1602389.1 DUF1654 domain-containing protein [Pseudomonas typographi]
MAKKPQPAPAMSPAERLSIRVASMINHPMSQLRRMAVIHQLIDDPDDVWEAMLEGLAELDELSLIHNDDGTVTVAWEASDYEPVVDTSEQPDLAREGVVERINC